jgi:hypothetical protein
MTAWKPEVKVAGKWCRNGLVFATEAEAKESADNLMWRWVNVEESRAVEVDEPVNYRLVDGENVWIGGGDATVIASGS